MSNDQPKDASANAQDALEAFIAQNPDLLQLEKLLARFNIFEAMGTVRHELRHSDFLSFLLDPNGNHGLNALFLKGLLQEILLNTDTESDVSLFDLDFWNLSGTVVQREWRFIDILVTDEINRFAWIIENKIDSTERVGQLSNYHAVISSHYPGYKIFSVYLTPNGDVPTNPDYHPVSYTLVCQVIEKIVFDHRSTLGSEIVMALEHYTQMLRRHIVSESEVAQLCRRIYQKHHYALDLIFEHKPDKQAEIGEIAKRLVKADPLLRYMSSGKHWYAFFPEEWKTSNVLSNRKFAGSFLYVTFHIQPRNLNLIVQMDRNLSASGEDLSKIHEMAFHGRWMGMDAKLGKRWTNLYRVPVLTSDDYDLDGDELTDKIEKKWQEFINRDVPKIMEAVRHEAWLWTPQ